MEYLPSIKERVDLPTTETFFTKEVRIDEETACNHFINSFRRGGYIYISRLPISTREETA
jgi:hypothetical protein